MYSSRSQGSSQGDDPICFDRLPIASWPQGLVLGSQRCVVTRASLPKAPRREKGLLLGVLLLMFANTVTLTLLEATGVGSGILAVVPRANGGVPGINPVVPYSWRLGYLLAHLERGWFRVDFLMTDVVVVLTS